MNETSFDSPSATGGPLDFVNPLCGSDSERGFSTGLTYPAVAVPWGMTFFSPRNRSGGHVFSRRRSWPINRIIGFTATHAPSPWMGDYGSFTLLPGVTGGGLESSYRLNEEVSRPDLYAVRLHNGNVRCELTATRRCGLLRVRWGERDHASLILRLHSPRSEASFDQARGQITGVARDGHGLVEGYGCRFFIDIGAPILAIDELVPDAEDGGIGYRLTLAVPSEPISIGIGTSFIDVEQARLNLQREVGDRDFEAVRAATAKEWNTELNRLRVDGGTQDQRRTLYTGLWRTLLFPRALEEIDASGTLVHRSPYNGQIEPGRLMTDHGFWDTSRTVYPLLSLAWRKRLGEMLDAWLSACRQSDWIPQWASPGHRSCMVGTHSAAVFADAITKHIGGFDHAYAYASMVRDASIPGDPEGRWGRQQLAEYLELGYCPEIGERDSVCRTIDYSYNDWCCARVAEVLGKGDEAATYDRRATSWQTLFDPETGFLRPKNVEGQWAYPLREFEWGGPYREGGPWQYRFAIPHDAKGLAQLLGGPDALAAGIERMVETPPYFETNEYAHEIHEMTEMAGASLGQYAHSNQPVHGVLWKPARVGRPDVTDRLVRRVLDELYSPEVYPGDEDNGEMGAWYVMAACGLGPHCPGDPAYTATPSLFDAIEFHGDDGLTIRLARGNGDKTDRRVEHASLLAAADQGKTVTLP